MLSFEGIHPAWCCSISALNAITLTELHSSVLLESGDGVHSFVDLQPKLRMWNVKGAGQKLKGWVQPCFPLPFWFALEEHSLILIKTIYWPAAVSCVPCWAFELKWNKLWFLTAWCFCRRVRRKWEIVHDEQAGRQIQWLQTVLWVKEKVGSRNSHQQERIRGHFCSRCFLVRMRLPPHA